MMCIGRLFRGSRQLIHTKGCKNHSLDRLYQAGLIIWILVQELAVSANEDQVRAKCQWN